MPMSLLLLLLVRWLSRCVVAAEGSRAAQGICRQGNLMLKSTPPWFMLHMQQPLTGGQLLYMLCTHKPQCVADT
jgi:hypothetical protein